VKSLILLAEIGPKKAPPPSSKAPKPAPETKGGPGDPPEGVEDDAGDQEDTDTSAKADRDPKKEVLGDGEDDLSPGDGVADSHPDAPPTRPGAADLDQEDAGDEADDSMDAGELDQEQPDADKDTDAEPTAGGEDPVQAAIRRERLYDALEEVQGQADLLVNSAGVLAGNQENPGIRAVALRARDLATECSRQVAIARSRFSDLGDERARDLYASARERVSAVADLLQHLIDGLNTPDA